MAACGSACTTSISTSPAACASPSRPPTSPRRRPWCRPCPASPLPPDTVYFGEVGLSGAIRPVAQAPARLKEAAKLGFTRAVAPATRGETGERPPLGVGAVDHIADLVAGIAATRPRGKPVLQRREG